MSERRGPGLGLTPALRLCAVQLTSRLSSRAPAAFRSFAPAIGDTGFRLAPRQRGAVLANLQQLLPESTDADRRNTARAVFRSVARYYLELLSTPGVSQTARVRRFGVEGYAHFVAAQAAGHGVIVAGIHHGPAEVTLQAFAAHGVACTAMIERVSPPALAVELQRIRANTGHRYVFADQHGARDLLKTLHQGGVTAMLVDRDVTGTGIAVEFCGGTIRAPGGPVGLAMRTGAAIIPATVRWLPQGRVAVTLLAPLTFPRLHRDPQAVRSGTERLLAVFAPHLRSYPDQWLVLERMWQPPAGNQSVY